MFWEAIYTYHLDSHVCSINRVKVQSGFFLISSPPISFPFLTQLTVITFHFNNHNKTSCDGAQKGFFSLPQRVNSPPAGADFNNISFEHPSFLDPCLVWEIENTVLEEDHISSILTVCSPCLSLGACPCHVHHSAWKRLCFVLFMGLQWQQTEGEESRKKLLYDYTLDDLKRFHLCQLTKR